MSLDRWLVFPFFLLRLGLVIAPTILKVGLLPLGKYIHLVLAFLVLVIALVFSLIRYQTFPLFTRFFPQPTPSISFELINKEISYWEKLRSLQPQHRDVLINLSLLYHAKGETTKAQELLDQARQLDPNNPYFAVPSPRP